MITLCVLTSNPARDIIEGRTKLRTLRTVPIGWTEPKPFVKTTANFAPAITGAKHGILDALLEKFHQRIGGQEFTAKECAHFFIAIGLESTDHVKTANYKLNQLATEGRVIKNPIEGAGITWRFPDSCSFVSIRG